MVTKDRGELGSHLGGGIIAKVHDNIQVSNAAWYRPRRVCDIWWASLNIQIDTLRTVAYGLTDSSTGRSES